MLDLLKFGITAKNRSGSAFSEVKKDLKGVKGMMASVSAQGKRLGRNLRNVGAGMSVGVTAPLAMMGKQMITLYDTQAQAEKTVAAAITSTGGAAGKTLDQLKGLASGLQNVTTYGDEDILRNVTAPLLTFTKIQGDVFDRAQANVLDYATLMKTDLKSASIQVGKALNDPIKGVSALGKAGVQFTEEQKGMIKSLVETGDVAGAQAIVLKELETQFKGQAAVAAAAPLGQFKQLSNAIGDVKEELGKEIVPFLKPLVESVKSAVTWFSTLSPEVKRNIVVVGGLAAAVGPLVTGLGLMVMGVTAVGGALATMGSLLLANPVIAGIAAIAAGAYLIYRNWDGIKSWASGVWGSLKTTFFAGVDAVKSYLLNFTAAGLIYQHWDGIAEWFSGVWTSIKTGVATGWALITGELVTAIRGVWTAIKNEVASWPGRMQAFGSDMIRSLWAGITGENAKQAKMMEQVGTDITGGLKHGILKEKASVGAAMSEVSSYLEDVARDEVDSNSPSKVFMKIGKDVVDGLALGVRNNADLAITEITGLTGRIKDEAEKSTSFMGRFRDGAKSVFTSVLTGAQNLRGALAGVLGGWANQLFTSGTNLLFDTIWPFEKGGAVQGGRVLAYARGGVVGGPTTFPMAGGNTGLMGEAGPEAIMPLKRGPDGRLGVHASGGGHAERGGTRAERLDVTITMDPSTGSLGAFVRDAAGRIVAEAAPRVVQQAVSAVDARMRRTKSFGQPA